VFGANVEEALSKCELAKAELEIDISKVRMEAAGLQDAMIKTQNLNDGLEQDKVDLSKLLMQVASLKFFIQFLVARVDGRTQKLSAGMIEIWCVAPSWILVEGSGEKPPPRKLKTFAYLTVNLASSNCT